MAAAEGPNAPGVTDRDIVTTRLIPAPRERVFAAWTDPVQLARWWGPEGFTNTFQEFDLKPGGHWRFIMHGPDDTNFPNHSVFTEITPPERLVFDHLSAPRFQVTTAFEEVPEGTWLTFRMRFGTAAECEAIQHFAEAGNEQVFDRLVALLAQDRARP
jgi:uncharacterized protein YndB with AHSA1/START domain